MDLNKAMMIGRLTRDPEMRATPQGINVTSFSIATNSSFGQKDQVEYHNIVAWRKLGEIANQYLKKGSQVYVEGRIQSRKWTGTDGQERNRTEIIIDNMIMLGSPRGGMGGEGGSSSQNNGGDFLTEDMPSISQSQQSQGSDDEEITVEDIPF